MLTYAQLVKAGRDTRRELLTAILATMTIDVKVKCFNGKSYDIAVDPSSESVAAFQKKISDLSGITPERQTILVKGKVLDEGGSISDYAFTEGVTISVVRRVGKATPTAKSESSSTKTRSDASAASKPAEPTANKSASKDMPSLEEMMRSMAMGGGAGLGGLGAGAASGAGASGVDPMASFTSMLSNSGGAGALGGGGAGQPSMDNIVSQLPNMMNGLLGPLIQEYLSNPEKQEMSREAIINNPFFKALCESDPEFSKVINDPEKWKASMQAAKTIFSNTNPPGSAGQANATQRDMASKAGPDMFAKSSSAADSAPPGVNVAKLSESYGHALGQSLVNSGLGLDPELVVKGLRSAVAGEKFPMPLPEYERSMAQLQSIAQEYLTKTNLEHANNLFKEIAQDPEAVILEEGKIAYEHGDVPADTSKALAKSDANVLVIVTARLLDGRHFFTCPAADDSGESVHPLTLALDTAPPALAKGITGMREGETRLLYVHPSACEGMAEMFGDLLPPNALLIFDLQLLSADAPEEESSTIEELTSKSGL